MLCQTSSSHDPSSLPPSLTPNSVSSSELARIVSNVAAPNHSSTAHVPRDNTLSNRYRNRRRMLPKPAQSSHLPARRIAGRT